MLSREEFVFTIGYDGPLAIVDNQAKKRYGSFSTKDLAEKGLFRAAYSSAVYSRDEGEIRLVAETFAKLSGAPVDTASLDRLFGVFPVEVKRSLYL